MFVDRLALSSLEGVHRKRLWVWSTARERWAEQSRATREMSHANSPSQLPRHSDSLPVYKSLTS
jgi:hypothetical protein